mmetsp:Transcript_33835/g.49741  ORF Transcript_33835/g.49741 Transcript_33835/m.49741 type:complete len:423 (-) Transcript_33835:168-1436(-)|eukprot:CAMPEP_0195523818 /NCGR_PEP_ID=MMETSP0794_2-20130614/23261_1 /TAXON_ID=515487 /ORGANISM="Stephanopyxis turris, Strain CCMP 815" /LENGTH=422 /DNA_ID=CAMNT_0040653899 /DNA_START=104 /DNA_END=1372 /DNA_ORIENTATION=-
MRVSQGILIWSSAPASTSSLLAYAFSVEPRSHRGIPFHKSFANRRTFGNPDFVATWNADSSPCRPSSRLSASLVVPLPSTQDLVPGIDAVDSLNGELEHMLDDLREEDFFSLYSVDMLGSCEYIPQELFECYSESCEIYPVDDDEVPTAIKNVDMDEHVFELDGWTRWDMPSEDYYDTKQFPESHTAYDGAEVWKFIHERICFVGADDDSWQGDFNKVVSGMHSMISAQVIRGIEDKHASGEDVDGDWTDPQVEFKRRLSPQGETPRALENMYFGYMLLLSAAQKARERLLSDCDAGKLDADSAGKLKLILAHPLIDDESISVASHKLHDHAVKDADSIGALWEARMRSRELLRIMNCVQCNKCRFHGKISALGITTALQILLGRSGEGGDPTRVHRVELAALMTTLSKFSTAISYCTKMTT